jgi:hypothetical protein
MTTYLIEHRSQWDEIFPDFKEKSLFSNDIYLIGLDCEYITKTSHPKSFEDGCNKWFKKSDEDVNYSDVAVCLIQIANATQCLIINLCTMNLDLPPLLIDLLESEKWIKTGVGINLDMKYLSVNIGVKNCDSVFDVKIYASLVGCSTPNLKNVYESLYNEILDKKICDSKHDWSKKLTVNHLKYASNDAFASYKIGKQMLKNLSSSFSNILNDKNKNITKVGVKPILTLKSKELNYIGLIQEYSQKEKLELPQYNSIQSDNIKFTFCYNCIFMDKKTFGYGNSLKQAKTDAAKKMYEKVMLFV